jgi:hypothetical protein
MVYSEQVSVPMPLLSYQTVASGAIIFLCLVFIPISSRSGIPIDIEFVGDVNSDLLSIRAGGAPNYVLQLSHGWLFEILHLIKTSPMNTDEFKD